MFDLMTIVGMSVGFLFMGVAILTAEGSDIAYFLDMPSVYITYGGTLAAVMISFPVTELKGIMKVAIKAFVVKPMEPKKLIDDCRRYAELARRDGILALENITSEIKDPFLVRGVQLAVDGTDPDLIQQMMTTELEYILDRHEKGKQLFDSIAKYCPAFGMIGTLIGLILMLRNLSDPSALGAGMGVAIITTLYGAIVAYLVATPIADKLAIRSKEEQLIKEMMIKGVMSIQSGDNPRIVEQKLKIFLAPRMR